MGDNLEFLLRLPDSFIDLVYIDSPFFTQATHRGRAGGFEDRWHSIEDFIHFLDFRLREIKRVLKPNGSIYVQSYDRAVHYIKVRMDAIFGIENFRNSIRWRKVGMTRNDTRNGFSRCSEEILFYNKSNSIWNPIYFPLSESSMKRYSQQDENGRFTTTPLFLSDTHRGKGYKYSWNGITRNWRHPKESMRRLEL